MKTLISSKSKRFNRGTTTAYLLDEGDGKYGFSVITRLDGGSYLTECKETGLASADATKRFDEAVKFYCGDL